ncbi:tripartite tricarboxylate transporter substrate binding protein [Parapusillimonas sp. SGNA-6]|nr:tripartite tricarboxylate transporter substrate binding protein [Parapusillimonas sp. SGNA-6]
MKTFSKLLCGLALLAAGPASLAADFPTRAVTWVVPWAAGGASDTVGRIVGEQLSTVLKQPVIVDNRPGAGGNIGTEMVARATADGYTLVQLTDATTISPGLYPTLKYDPISAFAPISLIATGPHVMVVNAASPIQSLADLVSTAKDKPGTVNYATAGIGSAQHLAAEMFKQAAKVDMVHVPYKGGAPAMVDVLSGEVPMGIFGLAPALPHIKSGKLRAIAVTSVNRSAVLPDTPTVAESGYPGFASVQWFGLAAPAGTPAAVVSRLNEGVVGVLKDPKVVERLKALGAEVAADSPEQFAQYIKQDTQRWSRIISDSGIKLE